MAELDHQAERARRLEAERDALRAAVEGARARLEDGTRALEGRATAIASRRARRRVFMVIAFAVLTIGVAVGGIIYAEWLADETFEAEVIAAEGAAPAAIGQRCRVRLEREHIEFNGRFRVDCEGRRVYGANAFGGVHCTTREQRALECVDEGRIAEDGDPRLRFERDARRLRIDDSPRWSLELTLAP